MSSFVTNINIQLGIREVPTGARSLAVFPFKWELLWPKEMVISLPWVQRSWKGLRISMAAVLTAPVYSSCLDSFNSGIRPKGSPPSLLYAHCKEYIYMWLVSWRGFFCSKEEVSHRQKSFVAKQKHAVPLSFFLVNNNKREWAQKDLHKRSH